MRDDGATLVGEHGWVKLLAVSGTDQDIARAARTSTGRSVPGVSSRGGIDERDTGLVRRLLKDGHTVPFEHVVFTFNMRLPIYVARQIMRHRFSSFSEESGRYVVLADEYEIPASIRLASGKAMDYAPLEADEALASSAKSVMRQAVQDARRHYDRLLELGVAKEQARIVLPVCQMTTIVWTVNTLGLMNFLRLRLDSHAQAEIREYAQALSDIMRAALPVTHAAFVGSWLGGQAPPPAIV